jgi:hypothetical protein
MLALCALPLAAQARKANCVLYARTIVDGLPMGLFTLDDKLQYVRTRQPRVGYTAVMRPNHLAVVLNYDDRYVVVRHENWPRGSGPKADIFARNDNRLLGYIPTRFRAQASL